MHLPSRRASNLAHIAGNLLPRSSPPKPQIALRFGVGRLAQQRWPWMFTPRDGTWQTNAHVVANEAATEVPLHAGRRDPQLRRRNPDGQILLWMTGCRPPRLRHTGQRLVRENRDSLVEVDVRDASTDEGLRRSPGSWSRVTPGRLCDAASDRPAKLNGDVPLVQHIRSLRPVYHPPASTSTTSTAPVPDGLPEAARSNSAEGAVAFTQYFLAKENGV